MKDNEFKLLYFMLLAIFIVVMLTSSWESYLHYLNRKRIIEAIKSTNQNWSVEQIQGLINSKQQNK
jgi:hypothetical protein